MGIEPISSAWKADNLPLIYIRNIKILNTLVEGCVAEWSKVLVLKTSLVIPTWVQIPPHPANKKNGDDRNRTGVSCVQGIYSTN